MVQSQALVEQLLGVTAAAAAAIEIREVDLDVRAGVVADEVKVTLEELLRAWMVADHQLRQGCRTERVGIARRGGQRLARVRQGFASAALAQKEGHQEPVALPDVRLQLEGAA